MGFGAISKGIVMGSQSTNYESDRNLANRLVKNELSRGTVSTKIETSKSETNKCKTEGWDFRQTYNEEETREWNCVCSNYDSQSNPSSSVIGQTILVYTHNATSTSNIILVNVISTPNAKSLGTRLVIAKTQGQLREAPR